MQKGVGDKYVFYPVRIGKHIVCIYGDSTATALQTACRGEPRTPVFV